MDWLQPYLDKMKIIFKKPCKKRDMDRRHYGIKIWEEVFNYYGSNKDYEDEKGKKKSYIGVNPKSLRHKYKNMKLPTTDKILTDALNCLVNDYWIFDDYDMEDFIDVFGYKVKEWIMIWKELEINYYRMNNVFTTDEMNRLREMFQDY